MPKVYVNLLDLTVVKNVTEISSQLLARVWYTLPRVVFISGPGTMYLDHVITLAQFFERGRSQRFCYPPTHPNVY